MECTRGENPYPFATRKIMLVGGVGQRFTRAPDRELRLRPSELVEDPYDQVLDVSAERAVLSTSTVISGCPGRSLCSQNHQQRKHGESLRYTSHEPSSVPVGLSRHRRTEGALVIDGVTRAARVLEIFFGWPEQQRGLSLQS